ncbi:hypothetical protein Nepgr_004101 [Nepenthes gracilis]|uniref:Uncharacterized protein n=1 Tax=Nepenthes gracilis TaxID=150966 RepID=A0AAD3XEQ2_NEPGR|nr:hypothetical protein Nepgr_004101 [Nepenthes gracilis]
MACSTMPPLVVPNEHGCVDIVDENIARLSNISTNTGFTVYFLVSPDQLKFRIPDRQHVINSAHAVYGCFVPCKSIKPATNLAHEQWCITKRGSTA